MRTNPMPKAVAAGLIMLVAAQGASYYLTRIDAKSSGALAPAIQVRTFTEPVGVVVVANTSDRAARCRMDFSTGPVPAGSSSRTIPPHGRWIARSPVAGPVGVIDVGVNCSPAPA